MKRIIFRLSLFAMLLFSAPYLKAQGVPPPPPPGQNEDQPAPLGSGLGILAALGLAYGAKKLYDARKDFKK